MPCGLASGATFQDIAAYVAQVADRPGQDTGLLADRESAGSGKPAVEKAGKLEIEADPQGQLAYTDQKGDGQPGCGDGFDEEHVWCLSQHRDRSRRGWSKRQPAPCSAATKFQTRARRQ